MTDAHTRRARSSPPSTRAPPPAAASSSTATAGSSPSTRRSTSRSSRSRAGSSTTPPRSGPTSRRSSPAPSRRPASPRADVKAIGITNQRETTLLWDKNTGEPVHNAHRLAGHPHRRALPGAGPQRRPGPLPPRDRPAAGLVLRRPEDPLAAGQRRGPARARRGAATSSSAPWTPGSSGTSPAASNGGVHVTDVTNASRTMLMNLHTLEWDEKIAESIGVPAGDAAGDPLLRRGVRRRAEASALLGRRPGRLRARRPAGRAVRPDLLRRGRGQVHLRHRHVHADEHRRASPSTPTTAC